MSEQIVSALLRESPGQRWGPKLSSTTLLELPSPSPSPSTSAATAAPQLVQPLEEFMGLASKHTDRLPPVLCARPAASEFSADDPFSLNVLEPVRIAAHVLAAIRLVDGAYAMVNRTPGQLLYCESELQRPRMLLLTSSTLPTLESAGTGLWPKIIELCRQCKVRHFGVTNYERWTFGCLSAGYGSAWLSPHIATSSTQPTVPEALCYWMAQSRKTPSEEASPSLEPLPSSSTATAAPTIEDALPAPILRRPSSSAAIRPPDPDENVKPSTPRRRKAAVVEDEGAMMVSPRKRKAAHTGSTEDAEPALTASPSKKRRAEAKRGAGEDNEELQMLTLTPSPSKKRRADEGEDNDQQAPPATPTPSPKKRRVVDDLLAPSPTRRSPTKVPLPDSPSPRKPSPRKRERVPSLPAHMQMQVDAAEPSGTSSTSSSSASSSSASARGHAFVTPPTSVRPSTPPPAPPPYSSHSPAKNYAASRESPSPRRRGRGRRAGGGDAEDDDVFWAAGEGGEELVSPRKLNFKAAPDSPRKRKVSAVAEDVELDLEASPRKRRAATAVAAAGEDDRDDGGSPRKRRVGLRTRARSKGE